MQENALHRAEIDWPDVRAQVIERTEGAQTIRHLFPAIALALGLLRDQHSFYQAASGTEWVGNPNARACSAPAVADPTVPANVGYVRVDSFSDSTPGADVAFADQIEDRIRSQDAPGLAGWIVDVRGNGGGNMWPMIAGIGPILGEGIAGYFVLPLGMPSIPWGYRDGASFYGESEYEPVRTSNPYTLIAPMPRVAVLTDKVVASSGEAVVVAFRERPRTRSFGSATCGPSTANRTFNLSDGAKLFLTDSVMADRTRTAYGDTIEPDVQVSGDTEVVQRAVAWLLGSPQ